MIFWLIVGVLATYRLTLLLYDEDGPFDLIGKGHDWLEGNPHQFNPGPDGAFLRALHQLFDCFWCLSVWVALPVALWLWWNDWGTAAKVWPALSAGAILLDAAITKVQDKT